ncbi:MAG: type VI secretion system contractile sheath large subunit, partial [Betaproteobacteria bacterium]
APLVHQKGTDNAAFFSVQSAQKAKVYDDPKASASARMSAQLPYIFATSRFAHYLKVMMRDKIGGYTSRSQIDAFLTKWIQNYVAPTDAPGMVKAKRPLSEARIDVVEVAGKPGVFRAVAFLKPHYQLDELAVSMRLVAELPPPAA